MKNGKKIGLSLSGGGYRATIYHLGTLKKLNEMGILKDIDVISSVSGGSITSAYFGLFGSNFEEFEQGLSEGVSSNIITKVLLSARFVVFAIPFLIVLIGMIFLLFTTYAWISFVMLVVLLIIISKFQFIIFPLSKIIEKVYDRSFFKGKVLDNMRDYPVIAINSTNLETCRPFTFSKNKMSDSKYEYPGNNEPAIRYRSASFPIARAVAASTCVPFAFTPVVIDKKFYENEADYHRANPKLVDGGVYDNQGIHKLTQPGSSYESDIIITSDAGNMLPFESKYRNTIELLLRTSEVFMQRIKNFQLIRNVYENTKASNKEIAYFSLGWNIENSIPGFIDNLKRGKVPATVIEAHRISQSDIDNSSWEQVASLLKKNIDYVNIEKQNPTHQELSIARKVSTNLKPLKKCEIDALMKHAACMAELQVKLYCPTLLK